MTPRSRFLAIGAFAVGLLLTAGLSATAASVQSTTADYVTFRDCVADVNGVCDTISPILFSAYGGSPGGLSASASITSPTFGTSTSDITLSGDAGAPIISTYARAELLKRVSTNSFALQRYTYTGALPTTRTFGGTLTYSQTIPDPSNEFYEVGYSGVHARIAIFTSSAEFVDVGTTAESNYQQAYAFSFGGAPTFQSLGEDIFWDRMSNLVGNRALQVTLNLNPGDTFWVFALLQTPASNGATVDASHTLVTQWDNSVDLVPANVDGADPVALLAALRVKAAATPKVGTSLTDKVTLAQTYLAVPDVVATCAVMADFISQVNALAGKKKLSSAGASALTDDARAIEVAIGCQ